VIDRWERPCGTNGPLWNSKQNLSKKGLFYLQPYFSPILTLWQPKLTLGSCRSSGTSRVTLTVHFVGYGKEKLCYVM
jgi:hypothetical protein